MEGGMKHIAGHFKRQLAIALGILILIAIIILVSAPLMARAYYEKEPYSATETYYETEPYITTVSLEYYLDGATWCEPQSELRPCDWSCGSQLTNKDSVGGLFIVHFDMTSSYGYKVQEDKEVYLQAGDKTMFESNYSGYISSCVLSVTPPTKEVTRFRDVARTRDVTKFQDVQKTRRVTVLGYLIGW
jgi:hypothetical protein